MQHSAPDRQPSCGKRTRSSCMQTASIATMVLCALRLRNHTPTQPYTGPRLQDTSPSSSCCWATAESIPRPMTTGRWKSQLLVDTRLSRRSCCWRTVCTTRFGGAIPGSVRPRREPALLRLWSCCSASQAARIPFPRRCCTLRCVSPLVRSLWLPSAEPAVRASHPTSLPRHDGYGAVLLCLPALLRGRRDKSASTPLLRGPERRWSTHAG